MKTFAYIIIGIETLVSIFMLICVFGHINFVKNLENKIVHAYRNENILMLEFIAAGVIFIVLGVLYFVVDKIVRR